MILIPRRSNAGDRIGDCWSTAVPEEVLEVATEPRIARLCSGTAASFAMLRQSNPPRDSVRKLLVRNGSKHPVCVIYLSSPTAPKMVSACMEKMIAIKTALGSPLGEVILSPLVQGDLHGRSYAAVPYCPPTDLDRGGIRARLRRALVGIDVCRWLHQAVDQTKRLPEDDEIEREFIGPMTCLADLSALSQDLRAAARRAANRVESGLWEPVVALQHDDLWSGNIMGRPRPATHSPQSNGSGNGAAFVLVDWYGASLRGRPTYDLVRLALSFRFGRIRLAREIRKQTVLLNCDEADAMGYLLASLGRLASQADHFPMARFIPLAQSCFCCLANAMGRP